MIGKRFFTLFAAACITLALASCGNTETAPDTPPAVSTTPAGTVAEAATVQTTSAASVTASQTTASTTSKKTAATSAATKATSKTTRTSKAAKKTTTAASKPAVTTAEVTQAPQVTQMPSTAQPAAHTHRWVLQWDDGLGTIFYWCPDCFSEKYEYYTPAPVPETTTATTAAPKPTHQHDWQPIYAVDWTGHYRCHCGLLTDAAIDGKGSDHDKAYAEEEAHQKVDVETFLSGQTQWTVSAGYDNSGTCGHKSTSVFFYYCSKCSAVCYPDWGTQDQEEGKIAHPGTEVFDSIPDWWDLNVEYYWFKDTPFEKSADFISPMYGVKYRYVKHNGEWVLIYEDSFFADTKR